MLAALRLASEGLDFGLPQKAVLSAHHIANNVYKRLGSLRCGWSGLGDQDTPCMARLSHAQVRPATSTQRLFCYTTGNVHACTHMSSAAFAQVGSGAAQVCSTLLRISYHEYPLIRPIKPTLTARTLALVTQSTVIRVHYYPDSASIPLALTFSSILFP